MRRFYLHHCRATAVEECKSGGARVLDALALPGAVWLGRLLSPGQTSLKLGIGFSVSKYTIGYMEHLFIQHEQAPFGNDLCAEIAALYVEAAELPQHEEARALDVIARIRALEAAQLDLRMSAGDYCSRL